MFYSQHKLLVVLVGVFFFSAIFSAYAEGLRKPAAVDLSTSATLSLPSITVLYDNNPFRRGLGSSWGFSCLVQGLDKTILFDTGGNDPLLLGNMKKLGIDPGVVHCVVLSHFHMDHVGGLGRFLAVNPDVTVYMLSSFPDQFKSNVRRSGAGVKEVDKPVNICRGVFSTGTLGAWIKEQSLVIKTNKGIVVITGCAHPGVVKIAGKAKALSGDDVLLVMGGFHLVSAGATRINEIISSLQEMDVKYAAPCHCSGDTASYLFEKKYGKNFIKIGAGKKIILEDLD